MAVIKIRLIEIDCPGIALAQMVRKRPERAGRVLSADVYLKPDPFHQRDLLSNRQGNVDEDDLQNIYCPAGNASA
ncbi:hypothetical protein [Desulfopila aestuarii]|uniref:Uncharacterized protein n=1 Tax=Desulfopila aestuarii DSM 18488 TaxID=1121416 RepID=A0A1M7Y4T3_9BACT|nr:hypothetical protein [Desulfopila aestuarii]SHO47376.1 hypothetical protein SAMN02745220_01848 [Desulfopila aestuarii DSM 18488]